MKITLDPGHGGRQNLGLNGYYESEGNLAACLLFKAELERYGFEVVMTRTTAGENPTVDARGALAAKNGSDILYSFHSDASGNAAVRGVTVISSFKRPASLALGQKLAATITRAMGTPLSPYAGAKGGVWTRNNGAGGDWYGVIRGAVVGSSKVQHAFLVEHGFHTNAQDVAFLDNASKRAALVKAEAKCLAEYFGMAANTSTAKPDISTAPAPAIGNEAPSGLKFRVYSPVEAAENYEAMIAKYLVAKKAESLVQFRVCADGKFRIFKPTATTVSVDKARSMTGPNELVLLES